MPKTGTNEQRRRTHTASISAQSTLSTTTTNEYLSYLNGDLCFTALEYVLTLLASQSLLALKDVNLSQRDKQLIKRELSTELSVFYDLVKKRILRDAARDEPLRRKKYGIRLCVFDDDPTDKEDDKQMSSTSRGMVKSISSSDRMRVNLTRKLHLESQQSPTPLRSAFNMTQQYSPITGGMGTPKQRDQYTLPSSTPTQQSQKHVVAQGEPMEAHDIENTDPSFCELSCVRLVEEDYLHFLSNLFSYICHTEKIN